MAFDYGSINIGIKNPFKLVGWLTVLRGGVLAVTGLVFLFQAIHIVKGHTVSGWIHVCFGLFLLSLGITALGTGISETLRYFVGRNHPTSLTTNWSLQGGQWVEAKEDAAYYPVEDMRAMLMARKNVTFKEPLGPLARLLHSVCPNLLYMPYPIRNLAQRLFASWVRMVTALVAYGFVVFVTLGGFAGEFGNLFLPAYTLALCIYLAFVWLTPAGPIPREVETSVESFNSGNIFSLVAGSILVPALVGLLFSFFVARGYVRPEQVAEMVSYLSRTHVYIYLSCICGLALVASLLITYMIRCRISLSNPLTEVSELRENWQESIHPDEIFINLDNLVMANRRYKEVPNRVYVALTPTLNEQVKGKGNFWGELLQEVQPRVKPADDKPGFLAARVIALLCGTGLYLASLAFLVLLAKASVQAYDAWSQGDAWSSTLFTAVNVPTLSEAMITVGQYAILAIALASFARMLTNGARIFFAEIQFESLLIYLKCEGTFSESKVSTGTGIYDSTRSENTLVRSSMTPWIIVSRIVSTTFASSGLRNLEYPRYILEMHKADDELLAIRNDLIGFLKERESIAAITSARDLGNASQIFQLNQQTRAGLKDTVRLDRQEEVAGYLKANEQSELES